MTELSEISLDQKATLASGKDFWRTQDVPGVPSVMMTDGPYGLRKQAEASDHLGISTSVPATCFPPGSGLAQSWDPELIRRVGAALGRECRAEGVHVLLGPAMNIRRYPLGGRSFEYLSEDPYLTGVLAAAWVDGIQGEGVGSSPKHFAVNNQETDRQRVSSDVDPRALREIYLRPFEHVVREARPWTLMSAYNAVNGVPVSNSRFLLTEVLRDEWGFDGLVVSDWAAVSDRLAAARAGLDLEMPSSGPRNDQALAAAVRAGELPEAVLDQIAARVAELARKAHAHGPAAVPDLGAHHALAREAAARCIVLLRNDGGILPLAPRQRIAVIGELAAAPRFQGGGSARVNASRVDSPLDEIRAVAGEATVSYAPGYTADGSRDPEELLAEAVAAARDADVAVLFLGLPDTAESEGWDRTDIDLPAGQVRLASAVAAANPATVAVLAHGGTVALEPLASLPGLLDGALLGQGGGHAIAQVLFGEVNPSGRLSDSVPVRLEDTPAFLNFPGEHGHVLYGESIFVGYRWYDARRLPVTFPFGHGLSYTTFEYGDLELDSAADGIHASVTVTNTGERAGRDVPQFYAGIAESRVTRAPRELKGLASVDLAPGESHRVSVLLRRADLCYWDTRAGRWVLEPGTYEVCVGASSRDLRATGRVAVAGDDLVLPLTPQSTLGELLGNPASARFIAQLLGGMRAAAGGDPARQAAPPPGGGETLKMIASFPLERMISLSGGALTPEQIAGVLREANTAAGLPAGRPVSDGTPAE